MFFLELFLVCASYACYTDINSLEGCTEVQTFTFSDGDLYRYLATHDFTTSEDNLVIELPNENIEVQASNCSNSLSGYEPLSQNPKLNPTVLHIKGGGSTNLILKSNFTIKNIAQKLVIEGLTIESEVFLSQPLITSTNDLWLKNVKFGPLEGNYHLISSEGNSNLKGVSFEGITWQIREVTVFEKDQNNSEEVTLVMDDVKFNLENKQEDCKTLIRIKDFNYITISSVIIDGSICRLDYNSMSPILSIDRSLNLNIYDSQFRNMNSVSYAGQAIKGSEVLAFYMSNVTFENIQNGRESVVELTTVGSVVLTNIIVTDCSGGLKGIFFAEVGNMTVRNLNCLNCETANGNGGGIYYIPYKNEHSSTVLSITNSTFREPKAESGQGGAIYIASRSQLESMELSITNTQFYSPKAGRGAAVYLGETVSFSDSLVSGVQILDSHTSIGGPIQDYHFSGKLNIYNSSISGSTGYFCAFYGDYNKGEELLNITDSHFSNGSCSESFVYLNSWASGASALISSSSISNFESAIWLRNIHVTIEDSGFSKYNRSTYEEASKGIGFGSFSRTAIFAENLAKLTVRRSEFKNQIGQKGNIKLVSSNALIEDSVFERGIASIYGGAIHLEGGSIEVYSTQFKDLSSNSEGGALSALGYSNVTIRNSDFNQVSATFHGGALFLENYMRATIENCSFRGSSAVSGAIYLKSNYLDQVTTLANSTFINNSATYHGGSVYSQNSLNIKNSYFQNSSANGGGAVFIDHFESNYYPRSTFSNCSFINNSAFEGGAINWRKVNPELISNYYLNNSAVYGEKVASYAVSMRRTESSLIEAVPGQAVQTPLEVALVDHYGNTVTTDNSSKASMTSSTASVSGTTEVTAQKGVFRFEGFKLLDSPGQNVTISIYSNTIEVNQNNAKNDSTAFNSSLSFTVYLRKCQKGEYDTGNECKICGEDQYSLSPDKSCEPCPSEARCLGNWTMFPKPGYWRAFNDTDKFYECPNPDACIGSPENSNYLGNCSEGYRGHMCQACQEGYSRTFENQCGSCPDPGVNFTRLVGIVFLLILFSVGIVLSTLRSAYKPQSLHSIYIKIFTNYVQLVYLTTQFNLKWPDAVLDLFRIQKSTATVTEQVFSVDCYIESGDTTEAYFQKLILMSVLPPTVWTVSLIVWALIGLFKENYTYFKRELITTMIVLFFLVHPNIVKLMFSAFACTEIEGKGFWLVENLEIECWDQKHTFYALGVALPSILVWGIGTPSLVLLFMYKQRRCLFKEHNKVRFGFLFNGYKTSEFYWEFLILYRKMAVLVLAVFLNTLIQTQALTCLLVLVCSLYLHRLKDPFVEDHLNYLENLAIFTATVTIYSGVYYLSDELGEFAKLILFFLILGSNLYFFGLWLKFMFAAVVKIVLDKFPAIKNRLRRTDGFDPDMYNSPKVVQSSYMEGGTKRFTLLRPRLVPEDNLDDINCMLDIYREAFKHIVEEEKAESSSIEELQPQEDFIRAMKTDI